MNINDKSHLPRKIGLFAAILGFSGVILGAFGAHALKNQLEQNSMVTVWDTAVKYHLIHAVALLALAAWLEARLASESTAPSLGKKLAGWAAACWIGGVILFSGSLYALALGGPHWLGPVTPLGGLLLILGWLLVAVFAVRG